MIQSALADYPFTFLACLALLIFAGVYAFVIARTFFLKSSRDAFREAESLPLRDGLDDAEGVLT